MTQPDRSKLAIDGGAPVRRAPLAPWPHYADDEIAAVQRVLVSGKVNYWTGQECRGFEQDYARSVGRPHAIAVANGTLALELALRAFGIGAGDEVIVTCRSFIASASAAVVCGATPVLADVDGDSQNITAATVEPMITPRTRAIIAVHLAGWPCDMDALEALAKRHGLYLIEDCAQANGAHWRGRPVGSFGDASAFSFCQDKIITTGGEGGLLVLSDTAAWERAWSYKDHGKSHAAMFERQHAPGYRWVHESFGSNWRLTEMQAAIGRRQLEKLDAWVARRRSHGQRLAGALAALPGLRVPLPPTSVQHAYYKFYAFLEANALAPEWNQDRVVAAINAEGIPCFHGTCGELYRERAFVDHGWGREERFPVARQLHETSLLLLVHPTLHEADIDDAARAVAKVMHAATDGPAAR